MGSSKKDSSDNDSSGSNILVRNILIVVAAFLVIGFLLPTGSMQIYEGNSVSGSDSITLANPGNLGTVIDSVTLQSSIGVEQSVGTFDGVDDYVSVPGVINSRDVQSRALWFKVDQHKDPNYLFSHGSYYQNMLIETDGDLQLELQGTGGKRFYYDVGADVGEWHHVVLVLPDYLDSSVQIVGDDLIVYFDGQLVLPYHEATIGNATGDSTTVHIGSYGAGTSSFEGQIADVRIYNRVLSAIEIKSLFDGIDKPTTTGLVGYWLDGTDTSGLTLYDQAGSNDGTINADAGTFWANTFTCPVRQDIVSPSLDLAGSDYTYGATLNAYETLVLDKGLAKVDGVDKTSSMTGSLGVIAPGDSATLTIDYGLEYEVEYTPYNMQIEMDSDLASGDSVVINTKLVTASGQDVVDQPTAMRIRLSDARNMILDKEVNSVDYVIPAEYLKTGGHRQARLSYQDDRFGGWSSEIVIDWDIGVDGYTTTTDADSAPVEFSDSMSYRINDMLTRILSNWADAGIPLISDIAGSLVVALG